MLLFNNKTSYNKRGFTLIEILVSMSIITILATVVLLSRNKYADNIKLKDQAYTIAIAVREAQAYSMGVRSAAPGDFTIPYGVHIQMNTDDITLFADRNKNGRFDPSNEAVVVYPLSNSFGLQLCGTSGGVQNCSGVDSYMVLFNRPNPTATMSFLNSQGNSINGRTPPAAIRVSLPNSGSKTISIDSTGQVGIQ